MCDMAEKQSVVNKSKLLNNLLTKRTEFGQAKQEYINAIIDFCGDMIDNVHLSFHGNKMYVTFESFTPFNDKYLLKFCNVFGFLALTTKVNQLSSSIIIYKWEFIKIL